ncbi:MAG TPA: SIMPL domain-containing protein [Thermoanaerobaculia bacterium]
MNSIAVVFIASFLLALPLLAHEETTGHAEVPVLTVSGSGDARVAPDEATVRLGVFAQAETARAAQDQVSRTAGAILEAIRRLGVPAEQIQTSELSLSPVYGQERPDPQGIQEPRIVGYQASNIVEVRLDRLDRVGPVIDAGLGAGANRLDGVFFGLRDDEKARAEALTRAVQEARAKADALARALKVRIVRVVEVAEGGISVSPPPFLKGRMASMEMAQSADTPVSTGQVGVSASVTIRYEIAAE